MPPAGAWPTEGLIGRARLSLSPIRQTGQEGQALLEFLDADELVCGVCLGDVAGTTDDRGCSAILEEAGLVITRRSGREKLHFLNAVPIRMIHDRWIDKYREREVSALLALKTELEKKE